VRLHSASALSLRGRSPYVGFADQNTLSVFYSSSVIIEGKGVVGEPGKTVSKRVKVSSAQLAVWGGDGPVTASP